MSCVCHTISCLLIAALWSPEWKGLTSLLLFVMFIVILVLSYLVSWDRCGTLLNLSRFLLSFLLCVYINKVYFHAEVQDAFIPLSIIQAVQ